MCQGLKVVRTLKFLNIWSTISEVFGISNVLRMFKGLGNLDAGDFQYLNLGDSGAFLALRFLKVLRAF